MEFFEAVSARHSTRDYSAEPVSEASLKKILGAACAAPVGMGRYDALHLSVVSTPSGAAALHARMNALFPQDPLYNAPVFILVSSADSPMAGQNAACIIENVLLAAAAEGLSGCYIAGAIPKIAEDRALVRELGVPEGFRPVAGVLVGHPRNKKELGLRRPPALEKIRMTRL